MLALLYGIMGLFAAPFFIVVSALSAHLPAQQRMGLMTVGIFSVVILPAMYAVMGFITGALGALIYNLVAKKIGGIEVEVE